MTLDENKMTQDREKIKNEYTDLITRIRSVMSEADFMFNEAIINFKKFPRDEKVYSNLVNSYGVIKELEYNLNSDNKSHIETFLNILEESRDADSAEEYESSWNELVEYFGLGCTCRK